MGATSSRLPARLAERLRLPLIAAPLHRISGPELVAAACREGVIGSFPTQNARSIGELDDWFSRMKTLLADTNGRHAPICPNLIIRHPRRDADLDRLIDHGVEMVITSVGSPAPVLPRLHAAGITVFADVATLEHARKAAEAGCDGLVLLTAGAGGQTGWLNPFAFVRAVREIFDGPIILAGGMSDGHALYAAEALGCDLAYMGTKFIAVRESMAWDSYRRMLVESTIDGVLLTRNFNGLRANYLEASIVAAGIDPAKLDETMDEERAARQFSGAESVGPQRWVDIVSAGHSVGGVKADISVAELVAQTEAEYRAARAAHVGA